MTSFMEFMLDSVILVTVVKSLSMFKGQNFGSTSGINSILNKRHAELKNLVVCVKTSKTKTY